jgi:hypothetical protein
MNAAKKPALPTTTKLAGLMSKPGQKWLSTSPNAPPPQPPITIDGPKTSPDPPLPIVKLVVAQRRGVDFVRLALHQAATDGH